MVEVQYVATLLFACAVLHTFSVKKMADWSHLFPTDSARHAFFHLASEVEVVFGMWAALFLLYYGIQSGYQEVLHFQESLNFTEPIFVFVIMVVAASKPVVWFARGLMRFMSIALRQMLRIPQVHSDFLVTLTVGPLLGSFITEPAAMTVTAMLLFQMLKKPSGRVIYGVLAVLFVNVSVGGALTHFAAPPILMVAGKWNWDLMFVFYHFGLKSAAAVVLNSLLFVILMRKRLLFECDSMQSVSHEKIPIWVVSIHYLFLVALVVSSHYPNAAMGIFLLFLGLSTVTKKYQDPLRLRESLLVAFFLGGIIEFAQFQKWWLEPLLNNMSENVLFWGGTALTAVTDNAALTYLGSQVDSISDSSKFFLVAGALAGGGLTLIANAPNAAGYGVLQSKFRDGFNPLWLFLAALGPTLVVILSYRLLPF